MKANQIKREKAATAYGEVEFETVDCHNCNSSMMTEDAVPVWIGCQEYTCTGVNICSATHERPEERRVLCEYCAESVLDYSGQTGLGDFIESYDIVQILFTVLVFTVIALIVLMPFLGALP